ncbi:ParA family protein [Lonepinella sp. BR2882]|uniref:ParA family protein n=1 Tax=Lonepinella sp. BR2882 TaxID=3095283 RepID=UPI003F6DF4CD
MGKVVVFNSIKGGVGKSTLAIQLAVGLARDFKVAIMDCDPQKNIENWACRRFFDESKPRNIAVLEANVSLLENSVDQYDFILVDSAGADSETGRELLLQADILISPLQPTDASLDTVPLHSQLVVQAMAFNQHLKAFYVFNDCSTHHKDQEAKRAFTMLQGFLDENHQGKFSVLPHFIFSRKVLKTSYSDGSSCFEGKKNKSSEEFNAIIDSIFKG